MAVEVSLLVRIDAPCAAIIGGDSADGRAIASRLVSLGGSRKMRPSRVMTRERQGRVRQRPQAATARRCAGRLAGRTWPTRTMRASATVRGSNPGRKMRATPRKFETMRPRMIAMTSIRCAARAGDTWSGDGSGVLQQLAQQADAKSSATPGRSGQTRRFPGELSSPRRRGTGRAVGGDGQGMSGST